MKVNFRKLQSYQFFMRHSSGHYFAFLFTGHWRRFHIALDKFGERPINETGSNFGRAFSIDPEFG